METLTLLALAYLCGSVPVGFLLSAAAGVDIRACGSGNIGATNVARVVGWRQGLFTLLGDAAKGFLPVLVARYLEFADPQVALAGLAAFLGHLYPAFLKFRGGKGVATAFGVLLAVAPLSVLILALVFALVAAVTRAASAASLAAAAAVPLVLWLLKSSAPIVGLGLVMALLVIWRHRDNIQRLLAGTEPKFKPSAHSK
ncbi:MAG TPA: glycerol-3-phosphate 1-O-acyltransferase PlsY [Candidatus Acidoferrales bacterium]|nr:glycerol-3-phosphate 1-O-acyltransferase PlsY [Candidatus Acidoferrales bacterium]